MKRILILGAGLSSSSLIKYMLDHSEKHDWKIVIGDISLELGKKKVNNHPNGKAFKFDIYDKNQRENEIKKSDIVISMLPAYLHHLVAEDCVSNKVNMVTASYVSPEIKELDKQVRKNDRIILNEIGVDPGIDHMSAKQIIDRIKNAGGKLLEFESSTGGLVAPEYDNNPWKYKFTWNPRNVIIAGQGVSKYLFRGRYKYIPYHKLFERTDIVDVPNYGKFEIYPNRDSLKYREIYRLKGIQTMFRGTMRRPGYCDAWNVLVQLGTTDDTYTVHDTENMTYRMFINSYMPYEKSIPVETKLANYLGISLDSDIMKKLTWLGIFESKPIGLKNVTPAQILQHLIEPKWKLDPEDKDMIVMMHNFIYEIDNCKKQLTSTMVVKGTDQVHTAMSITVGIPVAIASKLLLTGKIKAKGVQLPISKEIYDPVLKELEEYGVKFIEKEEIVEE